MSSKTLSVSYFHSAGFVLDMHSLLVAELLYMSSFTSNKTARAFPPNTEQKPWAIGPIGAFCLP